MKFAFLLFLPVAVAGAVIQISPALPPAMASLVEAERAFARTSVAQGRRAAFLAFFSDDSLFFTPEPASAPPLIRAWPLASPFNLDWEPRFGDVASSGELGYTTGPFVRSSPDAAAKVLGTGWYFTIWKRQPAGTWKVAIDASITSPTAGPLRPAPFEMAPRDAFPVSESRDSLIARDRGFCDSMGSSNLATAFGAVSTNATRVYREGLAPMTGAADIRSYFTSKSGAMRCEPVEDAAARSSDLGYTYGKYTAEQSPRESGYYLRVWKRMGGEWKLAFDLLISRG